ncbi:MAG TPA: hypothetical protein VFA79_18705 [Myxococcales bacterium]|nr:hypothetical protein [Myxococcales bacterium]
MDRHAGASLGGFRWLTVGPKGMRRLRDRRRAQGHEELSKKGVRFTGPPQDRPYGIETVLRDDSGNWFSLCQRTG